MSRNEVIGVLFFLNIRGVGLGKLVFAKFASLVYLRLVNVCLRKPVNKPPVYEIVYERRLNKLVYENCHEVYKHSQTRSEFANVCKQFAKVYEIHESLQKFTKVCEQFAKSLRNRVCKRKKKFSYPSNERTQLRPVQLCGN